MSFKHRIDPPGDKIDKVMEGCGRSCIFTIVVMWLASIFLAIYGFANVAKLLSR